MPQFNDTRVKLCGGVLVWDGVTQPEITQQGQNAGKPKWTLKAVFEPHNPDVALFDQLARKALQESKWRGQLPPGGRMPIGIAQANEFNGLFTGWPVLSFKTSLRAPDVYDENGALLDTFRYGPLIYPGQIVDVLAHCYEYDAAGNKGISAGMDAFAIIASRNAPRLAIGGGINTAAAFGGGQGNAANAPASYQAANYGNTPVGAAPAGPTTYSPGGSPQQPQQYGGGQQQQTPPYGAGSAGANYGQHTTAGTGAAPGATTYRSDAPTQAHNFLPNQQQAVPKFRTPDGDFTEAELLAAKWPPHVIQTLPRV